MSGILKIFSKRLIYSITTIFFVVTFIFIAVRLAPGDPTTKYISQDFSPEMIEEIKSEYGINESISIQYLNFLSNSLQADFGTSYIFKEKVTNIIISFLPTTLFLALTSFVIQIFGSLYLSILSYRKPALHNYFSKLTFIIYTTPSFVLGLLLILIFSIGLNMFPSSGLMDLSHNSLSFTERVWDYAKHFFLPVTALSLIGVAVFYKYLSENIFSIKKSQFVLYLKSNGYDDNTILYKHIIPNAIKPLISIAGIELGILLGGTLITEVVFGLPGMGRLTFSAILQRDYPLVIGCTMISAVFMIFANVLADLAKILIDKRNYQANFA